jgi:hypothetical protein
MVDTITRRSFLAKHAVWGRGNLCGGNYGRIYRRIMVVYEGKKKVLAAANYPFSSTIG